MSIEGRIAIDVNFAEKSETSGVQSLKKISLADTSAYTAGKVAVFFGTCNTTPQSLMSGGVTTYKDADGAAVTFSTIHTIAMKATGGRVRFYNGWTEYFVPAGRVAVVPPTDATPTGMIAETTAGTATYTLVLYGT